MKLSQEQAAAILDLQNKWQTFKILVAEKDIQLHEWLTPIQEATTKKGIELLRKYHVAAMTVLPNGIPDEEELARKQQFLEQVILQMKSLHQSKLLKKMEEKSFQKIHKKQLTNLLQQLPLQTPIAYEFVQLLKQKIITMKKVEDLKTMICILLSKYSLKKCLLHHYEQKEHWNYYQQEPNHPKQLQDDFKELTSQLFTLIIPH